MRVVGYVWKSHRRVVGPGAVRVDGHLGARSRFDVDAGRIGESAQVPDDIGDLMAERVPRGVYLSC